MKAKAYATRTEANPSRPDSAPDDGGTSHGTESDGSGTQGTPGSPQPPGGAPAPKNTRFYGVAKINSDLYVKELTKLSQEIIQHLAADGADLEICVEITARKKDGYPDDKVRIVTENARTLKLDPYGFEDR
jgi:hypothetical protein